jgi:leader peptidase (prepilin peptidase) / N-methyltransferase
MERLNELYYLGILPLHRAGVLYVFAFVFGASVGSFLNVYIYRWPRDLSVWKPSRSFCPACERQIPWYLNVPVLSWLMLRGKCKWCGARISVQYLVVELAGGLWFVAVLWKFGPGLAAVALFIFGMALLAAAVIDLYTLYLPDAIIYGLLPLGLAMALVPHGLAPNWPVNWWGAMWGAVVGMGLFFVTLAGFKLATGREGMGDGDIYLMGSIGSFVGFSALPAVIFVAGMGGIMAWLALKLVKKVDRDYPIPFGPFLSLGAVVVVLTREWLTRNWIIMNWPW